MTRFLYNTATTLNGFLADDEHSLEWLEAVPGADDATDAFGDFLEGIGSFVMGSSTYRWLLDHQGFAFWEQTYGDRPCFVATHRTFATPEVDTIRFVGGSVAEWVDDLAAAARERDVWIVGGGDLVGQFDDAGRLDEVRVSVAPVVLPGGKPLLPRRIEADRLELIDVRRSGQFAELRYHVTPPRA